jgi:two-component system sensor histidine kinase RegB
MWLAFGASGLLITYFVHSIALSLAVQREELMQLREEQIQDRHLASLGSLAAGAAHELGTPLGTIGVLVGELEHMDEAERAAALESIKAEVKRCKGIVQRMATPDARISTLGVNVEPWPVADLATEADSIRGVTVEVDVDSSAKEQRTDQPYESLAQIVRELLTNAADACRRREGSSGIRLGLRVAEDRLRIEVTDDGVGMDEELATAAFDPFLSTKPEGEGMGLGLYLSRAQLRQLGGTIDIETKPGQGTTVAINIPRLQPEAAS